MLTAWRDNADEAQPERQVTPAPVLTIPPGAALAGAGEIVAVQCIIGYWKGKVTGCVVDSCDAFHRIEAARIAPVDSWVERGRLDLTYRRLPGARGEDTAFRPEQTVDTTRLSLKLKSVPPGSLADTTPWRQAYKEIRTGLKWAVKEAGALKTRRFALLLICSVDHLRIITSEKWPEYTEGTITGVYAAEVIELRPIGEIREAWAADPLTDEVEGGESTDGDENERDESDCDADLAGYKA